MNIYSLAFFRAESSGYESPKAGTSQGIFFDNFIPSIVRAFRAAWKDWELWIHHDERVKDRSSWPFLMRCAEAGMLKLVPMGEVKALCISMMWRLHALTEPGVGWVVSRDVDSLPMHRDRKMVEVAMESGALAHAILDSESHSGPLMGGMGAWHSSIASTVLCGDRTGINFDIHGSDQRYLNREVWPLIKSKTVIHQRRRDIQYPEAMKTLPVIPQETPLDKVIRHIGAGYDRELAMKVLKENYPDVELDAIEVL